MTKDHDTSDIDAGLDAIEKRLADASAAFKDAIAQQHKELSTEFQAADSALFGFVDELEKGESEPTEK